VWVNRYLARHTRKAPRIDGDLGEPSWARAPVTDAFIDPRRGLVPDRSTRVKVLWDDRNIYIAVEATSSEDLQVMIQPDVTSPRHLDLLVSREGVARGTMTARTASTVLTGGWRIELAIPLAGLTPAPARRPPRLAGQRWGLNLFRQKAGSGQPVATAVWSKPLPAEPHSVEQCGDLIFANDNGDDPSAAFEKEEAEEEAR
jgi:hypothetical protein